MPILVGGGGKRVLSIAAREADIVGINPNLRAGAIGPDATADSLQEQTDKKIGLDPRGGRARASTTSRSRSASSCARSPTTATGSRQAIAPGFGVEPDEALESGAALVGSETEIIEQLHKRRERWDLSYVVVGDENIEEFAPIVAELAGN